MSTEKQIKARKKNWNKHQVCCIQSILSRLCRQTEEINPIFLPVLITCKKSIDFIIEHWS